MTSAPSCIVTTVLYRIKFTAAELGQQRPVTSRCPRTVQLPSQWSPKERRTLPRSSDGHPVRWRCSGRQNTVCGSRDAPVPGTVLQTPLSITPSSLRASRIPKRLHPARIIWQSLRIRFTDMTPSAIAGLNAKAYLRTLPTDTAEVTKSRIYRQKHAWYKVWNSTSLFKLPRKEGPMQPRRLVQPWSGPALDPRRDLRQNKLQE